MAPTNPNGGHFPNHLTNANPMPRLESAPQHTPGVGTRTSKYSRQYANCKVGRITLRAGTPVMRIHIQPGNVKRYNAAFYADTCIECLQEINEGDPIGYVQGDGPICDDCLKDIGTPTKIQVRE